jgi:hypothetical protein
MTRFAVTLCLAATARRTGRKATGRSTRTPFASSVVSSSATAIEFPGEAFVWPDNTTIKYTERAGAGAARSPARRQDRSTRRPLARGAAGTRAAAGVVDFRVGDDARAAALDDRGPLGLGGVDAANGVAERLDGLLELGLGTPSSWLRPRAALALRCPLGKRSLVFLLGCDQPLSAGDELGIGLADAPFTLVDLLLGPFDLSPASRG